MCIIVIKPAGVDLPSNKIIACMFESNKDGFGLVYKAKDDKLVHIRKGALTLDTTYKILDEVEEPKDKDMILHFRTATEGAVYPGNCHPFPITSDTKLLQAVSARTQIAIAHNGIITGLPNEDKVEYDHKDIPKDAVLCYDAAHKKAMRDGKRFVLFDWTENDAIAHANYSSYRAGLSLRYSDTQVFIRDFIAPFKEFLVANPAPMYKLIGQFVHSKFAFLGVDGLSYTGVFIEDEGLLYSNDSYKPRAVTTYPTRFGYNYSETKFNNKPARALDHPGLLLRCETCGLFVPRRDTVELLGKLVCLDCAKIKKEDVYKKNTI